MAVFLVNNCKFTGCGLTFSTLGDLIQHIEETHIDNDPRVLEKQELQPPAALSLSYILRFFTDAARKEQAELKRKQITVRTQSPALSVRSVTPTGSEFDDEEMMSEEDSDDSWTTQEDYPTDFILRYSSVSMLQGTKEADLDKPFACPVPGCKKRYKNVNGIKYHARNGHRKESKVKKAFKCVCGKSYKTQQGLRNHSLSHHPATELLTLHAQNSHNIALTKSVTLATTLAAAKTISLPASHIALATTPTSVLSAAIMPPSLVPLTRVAQVIAPVPPTVSIPVSSTKVTPAGSSPTVTTNTAHIITQASPSFANLLQGSPASLLQEQI